MKDKRLDEIIQRAARGEFELDPIIKRTGDLGQDVVRARNLQEDALGKILLEQYKGRVPNLNEPLNKHFDFAEGLKEQFIPDVDSSVGILHPESKHLGEFTPKTNSIDIKKTKPETFASTLAHEGLHSRDFKAGDYGLKFDPLKSGKIQNEALQGLAPELVDSAGKVINPKKMKEIVGKTDINDLKELLLMGHHGLKRGATIGQANLARLIKGLPLLGAAGVALMSGDASAAVPVLGEADSVGESSEDEKELLNEIESHKNYQKSPARLDRLKALMQNGKR